MSELFTTEADGKVRPATEAEAEVFYTANPELRPVVEDPAAGGEDSTVPAEPAKEPEAPAAEVPAEKAPPKTRQSRAKKTDEA